MHTELDQLRSKVSIFTTENSSITAQLEVVTTQYHKLQRQYEDTVSTQKSTEECLHQLEQKLQKSEIIRTQAEREKEQLRTELTESKSAEVAHKQQILEMQATLDKEKAIRTNLEVRVQAAESENGQEKNSASEMFREKLEEALSESSCWKASNEELSSQLKAAKRDRDTALQDLLAMQNQLASVTADYQVKMDQAIVHKQDLQHAAELERLNSAEKDKLLSTMHGTLTNLKEEISTMQAELDRRSSEKSVLLEKLTTCESNRDIVRQERDALEIRVNQLKSQISSVEAVKANIEEEKRKLELEITSSKRSLEEARESFKANKLALEQDAKKEVTQWKDLLAVQQQEAEKRGTESVNNLERAVKAETKCSELEQTVQLTKTDFDSVNSSFQLAQERVKTLESELKDCTTKLKESKDELELLKPFVGVIAQLLTT